MAMNVQEQPHGATTFLDLPYEVIMYICSDNALTTTDIYNLAMSHPKLNNSLFGKQNSSLWKAKYEQKYDDSNIYEFEIAIQNHENWRTEIMLRMTLNKSLSRKIMQMPSKYLRFKNIPYHVYPFGEELNSNNQSCQYYVYRTSLDFFKHMSCQCQKKNQDVLYMARQFLMYASKVFFGYMIKNFLSLPLAEQSNERGFYLLGCWWCPTDLILYNDLRGNIDAITLVLYDILYTEQILHSMFKNGYDFDSVIQNGNSNLGHDLYNKEESMIILKCINDYMLKHNQVVCPCHQDVNCFLLQKALDCHNGSVFILCVLYESIARRLGVKVGLISTSVHTYVSWTPSWPGEVSMKETSFSINIPWNHREERTIIHPDNRNCPENSISELLWIFSKFIERHPYKYKDTYRNTVDFQKLLRPEDPVVQSRFQTFPQDYEFCSCPLFRTPLNPLAPKHINEKLNMYAKSEDIFPLVPKRRSTNTDPYYSIGMLVDIIAWATQCRDFVTTHGVIVGWSIAPNIPIHNNIIYHILVNPPDFQYSSAEYITPIIKDIIDGRNGKLCRGGKLYNYTIENIYKYFRYYDSELCAFVPIDDLAKCYPDDFAHTVNFP